MYNKIFLSCLLLYALDALFGDQRNRIFKQYRLDIYNSSVQEQAYKLLDNPLRMLKVLNSICVRFCQLPSTDISCIKLNLHKTTRDKELYKLNIYRDLYL